MYRIIAYTRADATKKLPWTFVHSWWRGASFCNPSAAHRVFLSHFRNKKILVFYHIESDAIIISTSNNTWQGVNRIFDSSYAFLTWMFFLFFFSFLFCLDLCSCYADLVVTTVRRCKMLCTEYHHILRTTLHFQFLVFHFIDIYIYIYIFDHHFKGRPCK